MANGPIDQNGQGSAVERRLRHASAQYAVARGHATLGSEIRSVGTSGLPISERCDPFGPRSRGFRSYSADYTQAPGGNSTPSSGVFEKYWADHRSHRDTGINHASEHTEKAWLSRAQRPARFKFTLSICLTVCTIPNLPKPMVFWCPFGSVPSAAV